MDCPRCGNRMVARSGRYGSFWGCSRYPGCRGTRPMGRRSRSSPTRPRTPARPRSITTLPPRTPPPALSEVTRGATPAPRIEPAKSVEKRRRLLWLVGLLAVAALGWRGMTGDSGPASSSIPATAVPRYVDRGSLSGSGGGPYGPQYNGYTVVCADGWISHSGGRQGACSHHGGIR
jgi:hypothetical protein